MAWVGRLIRFRLKFNCKVTDRQPGNVVKNSKCCLPLDVKINRLLTRTQEFFDVVESHIGDLEITRMIDAGYYLRAQEELRTLQATFDESLNRVQHLDYILRQKYLEVAYRWQKEQRALNRHLANPKNKTRDRSVIVL